MLPFGVLGSDVRIVGLMLDRPSLHPPVLVFSATGISYAVPDQFR